MNFRPHFIPTALFIFLLSTQHNLVVSWTPTVRSDIRINVLSKNVDKVAKAVSSDGETDSFDTTPIHYGVFRSDALKFMTRNSFNLMLASFIITALPSSSSGRNLPQVSRSVNKSLTGTVQSLVPVVQLQKSLEDLEKRISSDSSSLFSSSSSLAALTTKEINSVLKIPTNEETFKLIFDSYSDPVSYKQKFVDQNAFLVYYTQGFDGPGRPSIEADLAEKQTLQYGARNDAWVAWDEFLAEVEASDSSPEEQISLLRRTMNAVDAYLILAPINDLEEARKKLSEEK